jgi:peroxiredoxin Q/BCP
LVNEGEEAPDFTLLADDERKVSLKDYRDRKVVLYFYPKDGTPGCTREAIEFRDPKSSMSKLTKKGEHQAILSEVLPRSFFSQKA